MLETALERFPKEIRLASGESCELRPLEEGSEAAFREFFLSIPESERLFIKHRITDRALFHQWCEHIDYLANLPLLAFLDGELVADGTLHQRQGGWKRHIGLVSVLVRPDRRRLGLVRALTAELVEIARHCGLSRLEAEFTGDQTSALEAVADAGFREMARLPNYVQDFHGSLHDYVLMGINLQPEDDLVSAGD